MTPTGKSSPARIAALAATAFRVALAADAVAQGSAASDRAALEALYDATGGLSWTKSGWRGRDGHDDAGGERRGGLQARCERRQRGRGM
jgi:hypothetical protein